MGLRTRLMERARMEMETAETEMGMGMGMGGRMTTIIAEVSKEASKPGPA